LISSSETVDLSRMTERSQPAPATVRDLKTYPDWAPGGSRFSEIVELYLPLAYGVASKLLPESPDSAAKIASAVFESFAFRCRRLSKRTVLASWFFRSALFAVLRERKRLRPKPAKSDPLFARSRAAIKINKLKKKYFDIAFLSLIHPIPAEIALTLRTSESKAQKLQGRAFKKVSKIIRKNKIEADALSFLRDFLIPGPDELKQSITSQTIACTPKQTKSPLARDIIHAWEWFLFRRIARRIAIGVARALVIIVLLFGTFIYLATHGYLMGFFLRMQRNQVAKNFPELLKPARPWPVTQEDRARLISTPPKTSAELYVNSNIWSAKLSFTAAEWEKIRPSRVDPVQNMNQGGHLILRNPKAKRNGLSGVLGFEFNWIKGNLEFAGKTFENAAVRYRGNGTYLNSLYGTKQSFKVDLNKFTKKQKLAGVKDLNFLNCIADNSYLYDTLAEQLFRDLGIPAPRTTYAYITLDAPGSFTNQPMGLYSMVENVDADFAQDRFGSKQVPILKPVTYDLFLDIGDDWKTYAPIYDLKTKATPSELIRVIEFARLTSHADDTEFARRLPEFLDIEEFAAFVAGHVLISSYDGFLSNGQNYFVYLDPRSNKFGFIPWDQDHAWGEFRYVASVEKRERASIWHPAVYNFRFLDRVMKVEAFKTAYRKKIEDALDNLFTPDRLFAQIDHLAGIVRPAIAAENSFRLKRFEEAVSAELLPGPRDGGENEGPNSRVHQIKQFIPNRIKAIREQLKDESKGVRLSRGP
jgi:hypothetical protein